MYGVKIGSNAVIDANSVVTKEVPEGTVVGRNPARTLRSYSYIAEKKLR